MGELALAADYAEQSMRFGERLGDVPHAQPFDLYTLGFIRTRQGRFDEALMLLGDALDRFQASNAPVWVAATENHLARAYWLLGQHARARRALATDTVELVTAMHVKRLFTQASLALDDEPHRAAELLRSAQARSRTTGSAVVRATLDLTLAKLAPPDEAVAICAALWPEVEASQHRGVALSCCARYADSLRRAGRPEEAAVMARSSLERMRHANPTLYRPEIWWIAHRALDAAGDHAAALTALRCARDWIADIGQRHVPEAFRDSFLNRNTVNRHLLAAAHRLLA
jgi:tetratricopeptide (TPR) repeat protein